MKKRLIKETNREDFDKTIGLKKKRENEQEGASPPFVPRKFSPPSTLPPEEDLPNLDRIIVVISVNAIINPETKTNRNNIEIRIEMV